LSILRSLNESEKKATSEPETMNDKSNNNIMRKTRIVIAVCGAEARRTGFTKYQKSKISAANFKGTVLMNICSNHKGRS
jgi:hypothetical protein